MTASTKAQRARTERPDLPIRKADLTRTERVKPLTAKPAPGDDTRISAAVLEELTTRLAEAWAAIERLNNRITGNNRVWACTDAIFRAGKAPADCTAK